MCKEIHKRRAKIGVSEDGNMTRIMIGNMDSGIVIAGTTGAGVTLKEYVGGERTGKVTLNHEEIQELIDALKEFV